MESLRKTEGEDMWLRVLDITLLQSCVQAFFVDHHVNLVRDMLKACDRDTLHEQLGHRMKERVDAFVTKFLDDTLPNVVTNVAGTVIRDGEGTTDDAASDDDLFCRYVKHKAHLTGANKAVLRLEHEKPQKLLEYARRVGECIPQAVDHASLLMLLEFVLEFVARVKSAPGRGEARACFDKAQTRYADFGRDHPQSPSSSWTCGGRCRCDDSATRSTEITHQSSRSGKAKVSSSYPPVASFSSPSPLPSSSYDGAKSSFFTTGLASASSSSSAEADAGTWPLRSL